MQDISTFFAHHAALLNEKRISDACDAVLLPTTVYLGDEILFLSEKAQLVDFMTAYVQKLDEAGLTETTFEILNQSPLRNDGVKVEIRWRSFGETGLQPQIAEMIYYCRRHEDDWKIALIEITTPPSDTFRAVRGA